MSTEKKHKLILSTEINIQAKPSDVWKILTDFKEYPAWNPFIVSIKGKAQIGERLEVMLKQPESNAILMKPVVQDVDFSKRFSWLGHLFIKGLFDGEHIFELTKNADGSTKFVQKENFDGILVPLLKSMILGKTKKGFESMNQKLKERAENITAHQGIAH